MGFGSDTLRQGSPQAIGATFFNKTIDQSLRFDENSTEYLDWTPGRDSTDNKKYTISVWIKLAQGSADFRAIFSSKNAGGGTGQGHNTYAFNTDDTLALYTQNGGANPTSTKKYRDNSAWYHVVIRYDTTQVTDKNRVRVYINGERDNNYTGTFPTLNSVMSSVNYNAQPQQIGKYVPGYTNYFNGYMAEFHMIDGQSLGPEYFGENKNGVWIPKVYPDNGNTSHGINGYHLTFEGTGTGTTSQDTTAQTNIGDDQSGNGNNFAVYGLSSTDVLPDSPTNNMAVLSSVNKYTNASSNDVREGGLEERGNSSGYAGTVTFDAEDENGYYFEVTHTGTPGGGCTHGMMNFTDSINQYGGIPGDSDRSGWWGVYRRGAGGSNQFWYYLDGVETATLGVAGSANDVWMYLIKAGKFYIGRNGTWFNSGDPDAGTGFYDSGLTGTDWTIFSGNGVNVTGGHKIRVSRDTWSHGNTSYKEIKSLNLAEPTFTPRNESIENSYFYTVLYEGNGGDQRVGQFLPLNEVKTVNNAIRFEDGDSAYLTRTPGSTSNQQTWTWSGWIKRGNVGLGARTTLFSGRTTGTSNLFGFFNPTSNGADDTFGAYMGANEDDRFQTTRKFRDTSTWYHFVVVLDTTNATSDDRFRLYVNGVRETTWTRFDTITQDQNKGINEAISHSIGAEGTGQVFDGYMADVHFVDGQALDPTSFGQTDPSTETWIPKTFTGNHGQNGFHLEFLNDTVGADSANTNSFTPVNLTTANTVIDTPTKNFATLDNSYAVIGASALSEGNLKADGAGFSSTLWGGGFASIPLPSTGKYYFECQDTATTGGFWGAGVCSEQAVPTATNVGGPESITFYNRSVMLNGTENDYGASAGFGGLGDATYAAGDIMGVAVDCSTREVWFSQNGTFIDTPTTNNTGTPGNPSAGTYPVGSVNLNDSEPMRFVLFGSASNMICNFGQDSSFAGQIAASANTDGSGGQFKFTPPTGFKALNVDNLPQRSQGIARRKTPVITWIKNRDSTDSHMLFDKLRGPGDVKHPDLNAQNTTEPNTLQKFLPGGFQIGNDVQVNTAGESYVAWNWCMHDDVVEDVPTGSGFSNGRRLVDKRVGLSIVTYRATSATGTIDHGLGVVPDMTIATDQTSDPQWYVWHTGLANAAAGTHMMTLDTGAAEYNPGYNHLNDTAPTANAFAFGGYLGAHTDTGDGAGETQDKMLYAFKSVPGFSKFGFYTGNANADGTYVHFGFKPAWLMIADTTTTNIEWNIYDTTRYPTNVMNSYLAAASSGAESVNVSTRNLDFVSNGIKFRDQYAQNYAARHIYMAFAESPFKYANAR
jgi:hypothetical protein